MKKIGLLAIVGLVAFTVIKGGKRFAERLKVDFAKISIDSKQTKKSGFLRLYYNLTLKFINNEPFEAKITSMALDVFFGPRNVGRISRNTVFVIPSRETTEVAFNMNIATLQLGLSIKDLIGLIKGGGTFPEAVVKGYMLTPLGRIEVNETLPIAA